MSIALLLGSIFGVLGLAAAAYWLGLGGGGLPDAAEVARIAEEALPGFVAAETVLSGDGRAALVLGQAGDAALLKLHGTHVAARRLAPPIRVERAEPGLRVESGERMFGSVTLRLPPEERDRLLTLL
jgi:hypothetical protein